MLVLRDTFMGAPLVSLQTGTRLGTIRGIIIDPRQLNIAAFYCGGPRVETKNAVIFTSDIREMGSMGIIIDSSDKIMDATELPRLQAIIDYHFTLEGKLVFEENGRKAGKVINYTVDTASFYIMKLHVQPGLLQSLMQSEVLIGRSQIVSVDDKKIIVRQAVVQDSEPAPAVVADNPFRKPAVAQPESFETPASPGA